LNKKEEGKETNPNIFFKKMLETFVKPELLRKHFHPSYTDFGGEGFWSNPDKDCEKAIPTFFSAHFTEGTGQKPLL